ncbi:MAG TPA: HprK-related kinase A [Stellaceae bacterium]|nr:HprK-related kinase A [Stellaceae bacterium]
MILSELSSDEVAGRARGGALALWCGPFVVRVASAIPAVARGIHLLYADHALADDADFADVCVTIAPPPGLRAWLRPQVEFTFGGERPMTPLALDQAFPLFEWALNWSIASTANHYLILHAAVIEREGRVLIMPGPPGSGKSTLTAALVNSGWRLFSDELTLIDTERTEIVPVPRPISLKNQSIATIRGLFPQALLSEVVHNTQKGSVAHMRPLREHIQRAADAAGPGWVVFPEFAHGAGATLVPRAKADTLLQLGSNAFNYHVHGVAGFEALATIVDHSRCFDFPYGDLAEAIRLFDDLSSQAP